MEFNISHVAIDSSERSECIEVMKEGNTLLKAWAEEYFGQKNKAHHLRKGLFKWLVDPLDPVAIDPADVGIPSTVLETILKVKAIEAKMVCGHVRLVRQVVRRYKWATKISYLDYNDLMSEGFFALRDSIHSFSDDQADFLTYAYTSIKRRLRRKIKDASDFGGFTEKGFKLIEKFNVARRQMEQEVGGSVRTSTVLASLRLEEDDERHLRSVLNRCVLASEMTGQQEDGNPYENLGATAEQRDLDQKLLIDIMNQGGIAAENQGVVLAAAQGAIAIDRAARMIRDKGERKQRHHRERDALVSMAALRGPEFWQAVRTAPLTEVERKLVVAAARGENNFQSRIIDEHLNPDTNEPYSRMSATNFLRRGYRLICIYLDGIDPETNQRCDQIPKKKRGRKPGRPVEGTVKPRYDAA